MLKCDLISKMKSFQFHTFSFTLKCLSKSSQEIQNMGFEKESENEDFLLHMNKYMHTCAYIVLYNVIDMLLEKSFLILQVRASYGRRLFRYKTLL